ncbi:MAG: MFS transporter [bacterium]
MPLTPARRALYMAALVIAGEAIFGLPFIIARVFRPTLLDVFALSNLQLGTAMAFYGVVAMLAYFPGGPLADRYPARRLMTAALLATALGGLLLARAPALPALKGLYAFWGLTTILLFWAALIRATREWGDDRRQGQAFGLMDGGRGLFAAVLASICLALFAALLPDDPATATLAERAEALRTVILVFTAMTAAAALLVWIAIPDHPARAAEARDRITLPAIRRVVRNPAVWLQGLIVVTAYVGYKGIDDLGLYARDTFGFDDIAAARVGALAFWIRPIAAVSAGFIGDRVGASRAIVACFALMLIGDLVVALDLLDPGAPWMLYTMVVSTAAAVYAVRGLYFALFPDARVPAALTGTAAGLVSVIGYTPDVFMGPLMGHFTDTWPGAEGHRHLFAALAAFAALGLACTLAFRRLTRRPADAS